MGRNGRCGNCGHFIEYQPIGGWLPEVYRGHGSCYPDGIKKQRGCCMQTADDECTIGRFEPLVSLAVHAESQERKEESHE